jgi:membrane dipeptidase
MLDHLDYIVNLAGVEQVVLGPDFVDYLRVGPGSEWEDPIDYPAGFENITRMPVVTAGLLDRGYDEAQVRGILGENMLRMLGTVMG